ncbi:MAG: hypothetical protein ABIG37_03810 [Nanoarchaeota archaeon]|nr:hypothetical protein [Nanoarchaeota archaeon]
MLKQILIQPLNICSKCLSHEINSWMNEKWKDLNQEINKQILEELKTIKLKSGGCIVCDNSLIADKTTEKILRILEENNIKPGVKKEFKDFFVPSGKLD